MAPPRDPPPEPLGFGRCASCAYLQGGTAEICFECANSTVAALAEPRCPICEQDLQGGTSCRNWLCRRQDRYFDAVRAVSMHSGVLRNAIHAYKYDGRRGWARIFGRVIAGFLNEHGDSFGDAGIITAMPAYTGPGANRPWDHIGLILDEAAKEEPWWPFDVNKAQRVIVKTSETPRTVGMTAAERERVAEGELRAALHVPDPERVGGMRIVVLDDVFTRGSTLREVARALKQAGAAEVTGLVLARAPWGS